jgi:arylsulfatase
VSERGPRHEFRHLDDSGMPVGVRVGDWKIVYAENRAQTHGNLGRTFCDTGLTVNISPAQRPYERADHTQYLLTISTRRRKYRGLATTMFLQTLKSIRPAATEGQIQRHRR